MAVYGCAFVNTDASLQHLLLMRGHPTYFSNMEILYSEIKSNTQACVNADAKKHLRLQDHGRIQSLTCMAGCTWHMLLPGCAKALVCYARYEKCFLKLHVHKPLAYSDNSLFIITKITNNDNNKDTVRHWI